MRKKTFGVLCVATCALMACHEEQIDRATAARKAAEQYYQYLIDGNYKEFANGILISELGAGYNSSDSLPAAYRSELADAAAQYAVRETKRHEGIAAAHCIDITLNADSTQAFANIDIAFGDSTHEESLLTLRLTKDGWKME